MEKSSIAKILELFFFSSLRIVAYENQITKNTELALSSLLLVARN
jgi:hypothetical protein